MPPREGELLDGALPLPGVARHYGRGIRGLGAGVERNGGGGGRGLINV